jgi:hypothetical protein
MIDFLDFQRFAMIDFQRRMARVSTFERTSMKLSKSTIDSLVADASAHVVTAGPEHRTFVLPGVLVTLFTDLAPYLLEALQWWIANGTPKPTTPQVLAKAHEMAAAKEIAAGQDA